MRHLLHLLAYRIEYSGREVHVHGLFPGQNTGDLERTSTSSDSVVRLDDGGQLVQVVLYTREDYPALWESCDIDLHIF